MMYSPSAQRGWFCQCLVFVSLLMLVVWTDTSQAQVVAPIYQQCTITCRNGTGAILPDGDYPDCSRCEGYISCVSGQVIQRNCPLGTNYFDRERGTCETDVSVCQNDSIPTFPPVPTGTPSSATPSSTQTTSTSTSTPTTPVEITTSTPTTTPPSPTTTSATTTPVPFTTTSTTTTTIPSTTTPSTTTLVQTTTTSTTTTPIPSTTTPTTTTAPVPSTTTSTTTTATPSATTTSTKTPVPSTTTSTTTTPTPSPTTTSTTTTATPSPTTTSTTTTRTTTTTTTTRSTRAPEPVTAYAPKPGAETLSYRFAMDFFNKYFKPEQRMTALSIDRVSSEPVQSPSGESIDGNLWYRFIDVQLVNTVCPNTAENQGAQGDKCPIDAGAVNSRRQLCSFKVEYSPSSPKDEQTTMSFFMCYNV